MAKVRFKNIGEAIRSIEKKLDESIFDVSLGDQIGELLTTQIKGFTRKGEPYNSDRSFPDLKDSTIESRKRLSKSNPTHPSFRAGLSAVTLTGQLMESLKHRVDKTKKSLQIFLEFTGTRKPYKNLDGSIQALTSKSATNEALANTLAEKGFKILSGQTIERDPRLIARVRKLVLDRLRSKLR